MYTSQAIKPESLEGKNLGKSNRYRRFK